MSREFFGTDGIRGVAGEPPLDGRTAFALGVALGTWAKANGQLGDVVIGMDTRESGSWLTEAVAGGLSSVGVTSRFAGIITTPGVAYLTKTGPFAAGVMISASHNPYLDNGLKVIGHSGYKLPDSVELELESLMKAWLASGASVAPKSVAADSGLDSLYEHYLISTVRGRLPVRIVVDCANGSAAEIAPPVFDMLGAKVEWLGVEPNGRNINLDCGSLHLANLQAKVRETGADLGVAFDGDADRALFVSGSGKIVDGDAVLFLAGTALKNAGELRGNVVIATVMSNLGLEKALEAHDIAMVRTPVGDKYVLEEMLRRDAVLGGEQSGHVIFSQYATTGDGLLTALQVLAILRDSKRTLDQIADQIQTFPQRLVNIRVKHKRPLAELETVQAEILAAETAFAGSGRVLVRFSGTEPLARVMIEAPTFQQVDEWTGRIATAIQAELGSAN